MSESSNQDDEEHTRKRRRLDTTHSSFRNNHGDKHISSTRQLTCEQYTVGWICALDGELTAAKAMLDLEHILPQIPSDSLNIYTVGSMCGHNVVIACLPNGSYGTTSATVVAQHMMRDFKSIKVPLMVGIGGGIPTPEHDIRLGDVVISTPIPGYPAVVQYDFGKPGRDGRLVPIGILNKPKQFLLKAAGNMKATHKTNQSKVSGYILRALQRLSPVDEYAYPGAENDSFYELICRSDQVQCNSATCAMERLSERIKRTYSSPYIHYGPIASGNQVMKDAHTRDRLAKDLKVLCFEMEAAGVMDDYQCLVIRGICDYCDQHKNKRFQGYAALAAAAVAKELLSMLPPNHVSKTLEETLVDDANSDHRCAVMEALDFEESDSRRDTVKKAHKETCRWLLKQPEYLDWLKERHGLLWIKGKPGTGKSTIMKFVLEKLSRQKQPDSIVISFFFNARGHDLEKSTNGMYRSLIHQLLSAVPELQPLLDGTRLNSNSANRFTLETLQDLFTSAIESSASRQLICLVDALDECPEDQIRSMVDFFSELTTSPQVAFHVLFSSRHYPNIINNTGNTLILEDQDGHSQDLIRYINAALKIGKSKQAEEIKNQIQIKSSGIFLWVVLVVQILRKEYEKGRVRDLPKKLQEIPTELDELFKDIILRDGQRLPELILCMQWILYAARPLRREELYFVLLAGTDSAPVPSWNVDIETPDTMNHLILDTSKGLVEITRAKRPTAQFIHESVREFLLKPGVLTNLYHGFQGISEGRSHQQLRECCENQVCSNQVTLIELPEELPRAKSPSAQILREKAEELFPFLGYAVENALYHAEQAECAGISQRKYMQTLLQSPWAKLHDTLQKHDSHRLKLDRREQGKLLYYLATQNLPKILACFLNPSSSLLSGDAVRGVAKSLVKAKEFEAFALLFEAFSAYTNPVKPKDTATVPPLPGADLLHGPSTNIYLSGQHEVLSNGLDWYAGASHDAVCEFFRLAVAAQHEAAVIVACRKGVDIDQKYADGCTALHKASTNISKILLAQGADVNAQGGHYGNALQDAASTHGGHCSKVKILIEAGADINAQGGLYGNALQAAAAHGSDSTIKLLIGAGADVNAQGGEYGNALQAAAARGSDSTIKLLIGAGADVNAQGGEYGNALQAVAATSPYISDSTVKILIEAGADVNAQGGEYGNALQTAAFHGHDSTVKALIEAGARVNAQGGHYGNALQAAAASPYISDSTVKILIEAGADVNAQGGEHGTALQAAISRGRGSIVNILKEAGAGSK